MSDIIERAKATLGGITPGSWFVAEEIDGYRAGRKTVVKATVDHALVKTKRVVTVDQTRPHWDDKAYRDTECGTAEANIAFIAAAPELVRELIAELEQYQMAPVPEVMASAEYLESVGAELSEEYRPVYEALRARYEKPETVERTQQCGIGGGLTL